MKGFCALLLASVVVAYPAGLHLGAAKVVINPLPGTPLAGYYSLRPSEGVLDDLHANTLVMECGGAKAAIVICDLITMPRDVTLAARELIQTKTGIPGGNVLIAATHSHTAPVLNRRTARDDFDGGNSELSLRYTAELPARIAEAVLEANAHLTPSRVRAAASRIENVAFNRRYWMEDGTVAWNPAKLDPRIIAPAGPHDPQVGVLAFDGVEKPPQSLATFVNYAMHPDTMGGLKISADYPGVVAETMSRVRPGITVFANGCCGNLNHRNVWWADPQKGPSETARLGQMIAGAACEALPRLETVDVASLRSLHEPVRLPLPVISEADRNEARSLLPRTGDAKFMQQVKTFRTLDVLAREGRPLEVEVQVITLGSDIAFVALPGEMFVELGLAIKKASPFKHTFVIELANGAIGYIPNRSAYAEGNYEVVSARCAEGSGEMLVEAAIKLLQEAKP